jgi:hypothetical protein
MVIKYCSVVVNYCSILTLEKVGLNITAILFYNIHSWLEMLGAAAYQSGSPFYILLHYSARNYAAPLCKLVGLPTNIRSGAKRLPLKT